MTLRGSIPLLGMAKRVHFRATSRGENPFFSILLFSRVFAYAKSQKWGFTPNPNLYLK